MEHPKVLETQAQVCAHLGFPIWPLWNLQQITLSFQNWVKNEIEAPPTPPSLKQQGLQEARWENALPVVNSVSCLVNSDSATPWTVAGIHSLLQGIFPTQ